MNGFPERPDDDFRPEIPERLREDLASLYGKTVEVPREVDEAVLGAARERLSSRGATRFAYRWLAGMAAAACLLLAVWAWNRLGRERPHVGQPVAGFRREDIDRNGRVDILDAFLLARRIEEGEAVVAAWDVNGDGAVDESDLDRVALEAVRVR